MSDPASNVGIEDVLASVRRLVSTEKRTRGDRARSDAVADPGTPTPQPPRAEALVLTADFRVGSTGKPDDSAESAAPLGLDASALLPDTPTPDDTPVTKDAATDMPLPEAPAAERAASEAPAAVDHGSIADMMNLGITTYDPAAYYNAVRDAPTTNVSPQGEKLDRVLKALNR